jgi:hypothetical protein
MANTVKSQMITNSISLSFASYTTKYGYWSGAFIIIDILTEKPVNGTNKKVTP